MDQSKIIFSAVAIGFLVRFLIFNIDSLNSWFRGRIEISTPLTSWDRVLEGVYLKYEISVSPYDGALFHEIPVMLKFYSVLTRVFYSRFLLSLFFIGVDLLSGILLYKVSEKIFLFLEKLETSEFKAGRYEKLFNADSDDTNVKAETTRFLITSFNNSYLSYLTLFVYYLNPYLVANCVAQSTAVIHNFILIAWLLCLLRERPYFSFIFLALHSHVSVYSVMLIVPSLLFIAKADYLQQSDENKLKKGSSDRKECVCMLKKYSASSIKHLSVFIGFTALIFFINYYLEDFNFNFVKSTYLFILQVPDLQPNMGLFWYFFTEIFDHFRDFFTYIFQLNTFLYLIPLSIRLKDNPVVLIFLQIGLISVLKSYPCIADAGLYLTLLPTFTYLFKFMRNLLIYSCMFLAATVLAPIMWHIWIVSGSGNANFYFAITLVYSVAQMFLLVDVLFAYLKREYIKVNGQVVPIDSDGKPALFAIE